MRDFTVIINHSPLRFPECGIRYYTGALMNALEKSALREKLVFHDLHLADRTVAQFGKRLLNKLVSDQFYLSLKQRLYKHAFAKTLVQAESGKTLYHETNNIPAVELNVPYITTVHDLTVFIFPSYHLPYRVKFFTDNFHRTLKSDLIVVPSHSTKQDLINGFGVPTEKIQVVPHGRNEFYRPIPALEVQSITKKYIDKPFVLFSGVIEPRKNLTNLLLAFAQIRKRREVALLLAGDFGWQYESIIQLPRRLGLRDVYFTGYVPAEDLRGLYNGAEVFVYPSLYEGFGFPPLEAMACGLPMVLSNVSSLPEVGGEAAMYVDPQTVESIVEGTLRVLEDTQLRQLMSQRGIERSKQFSWGTTAAQMITFYEDVIRKM